MRLSALVLPALLSLCPTIAVAQATLNKCIDAQGAVTYSNQPCNGARETRKIAIDPAPIPERPRVEPVALPTVKPPPDKSSADKPSVAKPHSTPEPAATLHLETRHATGKPTQQTGARHCNSLSDKLGRILDKMDQARRKGYTQKQMDNWNEETRELERKKQQSGCF